MIDPETFAFLLPEGSGISDIKVGKSISDWPDADVVLATHAPRGSARNRVPNRTKRWDFNAFPVTASRPRALLPVNDHAAARALITPRAKATSLPKWVYQRGISVVPAPLLRAATKRTIFVSNHQNAIIGTLRRVAPGAEIGCYLGNRHNVGRCTVQAFNHGKRVAIAKVAYDQTDDSGIANEASILRRLADHPALKASTPRLLGQPDFHLGSVIVTDAFNGEPCQTSLDQPLRAWLERCSGSRRYSENGIIKQIEASVAGDIDLIDHVRRAAATLRDSRIPSVVQHGDFVPWNIVIQNGKPRVFDWEFGRPDGFPFWDAAFFITQVGIIHHKHRAATIAAEIRREIDLAPTERREMYHSITQLMLSDLAGRYTKRDDKAGRSIALEVLNCIRESQRAR